MAKRAAPKFHTQPLAELAQQLPYAPRPRRREQLERAERLHDEIDPSVNYPFDYIAYRITHYRQPSNDTVLLVGEAVQPDLRLIIDRLSALDPPASDQTPIDWPAQLAERMQVTERTIHRWRKLGLRWRWVQPASGAKPRLAFTRHAVEAFLARHGQRVAKASRFAHLTDGERAAILRRARRLAAVTDASLHQVAAHLAKRVHRGSETIRQMLIEHDRAHPDAPLFADRTTPLSPKQQRIIRRAHRRGVPVGRLAQRFRRHRATIYRVINERRAAEARHVALPHVSSPTFERPDADEVLLRPGVEQEAMKRATPPADATLAALPAPLRTLYRQPHVADEPQRSLFRRYHYLKFKAARLRDTFDRHQPRATDLDQFDALVAQARHLRTLLVRVNLPTVLSVARRHLVDVPDPGRERLLHLLALGHRVLSEAIERYDPARSQGFSANLANRLMRRFANDAAITRHPPTRAHRRRSDDEALAWLLAEARDAGVPMPEVEPEPSEPGSPTETDS